MALKIAFTDIDGTLLSKERVPSKALKEEVQRITNKQIPFVLISSRMPSAMYHIQEDLNISNTPIICYNGGLVLVDGKSIHTTEIPVDLVQIIADLNGKRNFHISLYNNNDWYVEELDFWAKREENNTKVTPTIKAIEDVLADWSAQQKGAHKVMCMGDKEYLDELFDTLTANHSNDLHLYRSKDTYIEIAHKSISKLTGIKTLLKNSYPSFTLENCIAFGDNYNDIEMLEAVQMGVAVKNAKEEVLKIANDITDTNHNDGVAKAISKHL
ncbi:HAD family hydrolase [Flavicella sediminum]|uniref:HAD family hydrolase n=1 Tax=Flavicella sediminum TaxID=2585141 RepID=UPI00111DA5D9|nr:HAD family hydrolase [Flavicella sediminum]